MNESMNRTVQEALRLMQTGDLGAATQAIQRGLGAVAAPAGSNAMAAPAHGEDACLEGEFHGVADMVADTVADTVAETPRESTQDRARREPRHDDPREDPKGTFQDHHFSRAAGALDYKLFVPAGLSAASAPLIMMLHGCTQSPDDFARGTRMNELARTHGYVVAYPAQAQRNNTNRCWNWFRRGDQQRGHGEPALIAALALDLVARHGLDQGRVYVAGLSAGGAMAMVLARTYPEVFAAIGVHSGLPFGAAHDLPSAFAAMRQATGQSPAVSSNGRFCPVPAIVFHGDRDSTVNPSNGAQVVAQCLGEPIPADGGAHATQVVLEYGSSPGGRTYTRRTYLHPDASVAAEYWMVHGAGHAWSGGDAAGSYTDSSGPDASEHMLRFFSACARRVIN